ncbi:hypothetical protein [Streptomyces sp. NPDC046909]|uniref:hypothetical protein n=1 Tax=Streptomyces sp. NPDC046909 TaxID=3155617 RepID=UPI0033F9FE06
MPGTPRSSTCAVSGIHEDIPGFMAAATVTGSAPGGSGAAIGTAIRSAKVPHGSRVSPVQTSVPSAFRATASTPGTIGY